MALTLDSINAMTLKYLSGGISDSLFKPSPLYVSGQVAKDVRTGELMQNAKGVPIGIAASDIKAGSYGYIQVSGQVNVQASESRMANAWRDAQRKAAEQIAQALAKDMYMGEFEVPNPSPRDSSVTPEFVSYDRQISFTD